LFDPAIRDIQIDMTDTAAFFLVAGVGIIFLIAMGIVARRRKK
jgi:LPXTG-motif cell wall-anchored protein